MSLEEFDYIVVGAGVQGSFTAYHLLDSRPGSKVLLLDQFPLPHSRGSSHGQSRITRRAYPELHYALMMTDCFKAWERLGRETGSTLYTRTGLLMLGPRGNLELEATRRALEHVGARHECLEGEELAARYPGLAFPPSAEGAPTAAILEPDGGVLHAQRAMSALWKRIEENGGRIIDGLKVTAVSPGRGGAVTVATEEGRGPRFAAGAVVLAVGAWAGALLSSLGLRLPLQPLRINVCYWEEKEPGSYSGASGFPCVLDAASGLPHHVYSLPSHEYPGLLKVCYHYGTPVNPDARDLGAEGDKSDVEALRAYVSRRFPGLVPTPAVVETCMYTNTPDENFILDRHPVHRNIVIGAGFSGHGFKLAPVVGKLLAEMATGDAPSFDLSPFAIARFHAKPKSSL
ncbi:peroxisomal sarcosine oxidase isoform X1 [Lethenteron reissneri]|uniref:peroxisomal sarcosine oxidase isoform X1 n=1 Tax=Lethenteron reissneri TaxID=7753 RepID=UPI002AB68B43|nr:peroxisomal sarcosine oxidase isoform X1 [Lethenteron reissneri]XP_061417093.1 peroxisomal sarcosine oxidase isoform X1 [Lethenteron reissneri]XP_061417094.1 peroxisomal sarcosine oxidase isoform X1 [Lethenteron reissneri]